MIMLMMKLRRKASTNGPPENLAVLRHASTAGAWRKVTRRYYTQHRLSAMSGMRPLFTEGTVLINEKNRNAGGQ